MLKPLFDVDGVVIPSAELGFQCHQMADPDLTREEHRLLYYGNAIEMMQTKYVPKKPFCNETYQQGLMQLAPFPEMVAILLRLKHLKEELLYVTSSLNRIIEPHFNHYHVPWDELWGQERGPSKVEKFRMILAQRGWQPEGCIFVTDTVGDVVEAHRAGMKAMGLLTGIHTEEDFATVKPDIVARNYDEAEYHLIEKYDQARS